MKNIMKQKWNEFCEPDIRENIMKLYKFVHWNQPK